MNIQYETYLMIYFGTQANESNLIIINRDKGITC
jgi:hypothetical protein